MVGTPENARARAWVALSASAFVLPGLGSLMLGRRIGWAQAALGAAGFAMSLGWLSLVLADWWRAGTLPANLPRPGLLMAGVGVFAAGWLWALHTGMTELRAPGRARPGD
jgi:hypothetical protein